MNRYLVVKSSTLEDLTAKLNDLATKLNESGKIVRVVAVFREEVKKKYTVNELLATKTVEEIVIEYKALVEVREWTSKD